MCIYKDYQNPSRDASPVKIGVRRAPCNADCSVYNLEWCTYLKTVLFSTLLEYKITPASNSPFTVSLQEVPVDCNEHLLQWFVCERY